ncbi:hypothetical protein [Streptomyces sp. AcE210]|uniref:hypothetical protein n=1 Tax=Streptomyces sp. AcE210 TaxID=2292703 RepID=UPI000E3016F9|nr:hypothetical protein [Streptomyces sp. AcE210]RFC75026.1 hypothetical protein DXZ75_18510 [Streptomyces sp. AcE210]
MAEAGEAAAEAFLGGFPIVFDLVQAACFTCEGISALPAAPFSVVSHASAPAGPRDTFVSVDNDTSCSVHLGRLATGAGAGAEAGAFLPILGMYQPRPGALAGHVHPQPLKTAQPA